LPLSRGDAIFFQMAGFAGFAGQTKKASRATRLAFSFLVDSRGHEAPALRSNYLRANTTALS
ncbi:hypothetical protein, partial [uncultured Marinobacter sp.]|uniref:hypothetical protein n=1 Tax=uncultured Marinobacter sp. TaxID=187379 RepID=UPI00258D6F3B